MAAKKQWHPVFAELFRLATCREADFVLLRRTHPGQLPVAGLWRNLTPWNVLEFKGPTVSPRDEDLELLIELGLGIHRRLNDKQVKQGQPTLGPEALSLWFLANRLGRRLLRNWGRRLTGLEPHGPGVWRCWSAASICRWRRRACRFTYSPGSLGETEEAMARLVAGSTELWERYGPWLVSLHKAAFKGVEDMVRKMKGALRPDLSAVIDLLGLEYVIEQAGLKRVIEEIGLPRVVDEVGGPKKFLAQLSPEQRQQFKQILEE